MRRDRKPCLCEIAHLTSVAIFVETLGLGVEMAPICVMISVLLSQFCTDGAGAMRAPASGKVAPSGWD